MKLAKIFLPIAFVGFIGMLIVLWVLFAQGAFAPDVGEDADASAQLGAGIAAVFGAIIFIAMNVVVTLLFAGFGLGILICWICFFKGRNKFGAMTGALVLMCLILPTVLIATILSLVMYGAFSPIGAVGIIFSLICFLTSFIGFCVAYGKEKALRKRGDLQTEEN